MTSSKRVFVANYGTDMSTSWSCQLILDTPKMQLKLIREKDGKKKEYVLELDDREDLLMLILALCHIYRKAFPEFSIVKQIKGWGIED